jgi:N-methylhydantoinase A
MFTIVNNNMVNGIRRVSVERGYDPRDFVLVGAGGATAAHITALAREMGIDTVILPKLASGCAPSARSSRTSSTTSWPPAPHAAGQRRRLRDQVNELFDEDRGRGR